MAVMTDPVSDDAAAGRADADLVVSRLTGTLDTLASIARALHPPLLPALAGLIGDQDTGLEDAAARLPAAGAPGDVAGPLAESAGLALRACAGLRAAALVPGWPVGAFRALGDWTRAVEALYPAAAVLPAVSRWFLSPARRGDAGLLERLARPPAPGTGVIHAGSERGRRGGFSAYVPEYLDPATPAPLVVALHGGSGHGRAFLWTWLREARSRGLILVAPTATGDTWSLADPETDIQHLGRVLAEVGSRHAIDPARMLLTGMSDGGTFTLLSGLTETSPFTHLAPVAASFHPILMDIADPARTAGLPVYLVHGARDWMFPVDVARTASLVLSAAGARVTYREIGDLSHAYPAEENELIIDWLDGPAGRVSGP
jgi:phospholipase/carboxylesterase